MRLKNEKLQPQHLSTLVSWQLKNNLYINHLPPPKTFKNTCFFEIKL